MVNCNTFIQKLLLFLTSLMACLKVLSRNQARRQARDSTVLDNSSSQQSSGRPILESETEGSGHVMASDTSLMEIFRTPHPTSRDISYEDATSPSKQETSPTDLSDD